MKITVQDILNKLTEIDRAIDIVNNRIDEYGRAYPAQEPMTEVIERLKEYRNAILVSEVDI